MFRPLALYIGLRYTRARRRTQFVSFISMVSMLGIALGVAVLITVLSVMNGFDEEIVEQIFSVVQHVTVNSVDERITDWNSLKKKLMASPRVLGAAPFVSGQGLLTNGGVVRSTFIAGILPSEESKVTELKGKLVAGSLNSLQAGKFGIVLGEELANGLDLAIGDKVVLMVPQASISPTGITPRFKRFTLVGIFRVGGGFRFDNTLAFINLYDAQKLLMLGDTVSGIRLKIDNLFAAPAISRQIAATLPNTLLVSNWTNQFGAFFQTIKLEKNMMFFILLLIIAVAAFNLVSSLVMVVRDKQADIAILRTFGAMPRTILMIFIVQGFVIGCLGTLLGVMGGILLALNVTEVVKGIESVLNTHFISADIYFIDYLPSKLLVSDIVKITSIALLMSLLATIYPALRAAKTQPAEALRYE